MSARLRRPIQSSVNTPTVIHIRSEKHVDNNTAESILSEFVLASENTPEPTIKVSLELSGSDKEGGLANGAGVSALLSQLRRIQRSLRGLPPIISNSDGTQNKTAPFNDSVDASFEGEPKNKKIKFDEINTDHTERKNRKIKFDDSDLEEQETANSINTLESDNGTSENSLKETLKKKDKKHKDRKSKKDKIKE